MFDTVQHNSTKELLSPAVLKIIQAAAAFDVETAKEAGALGYMAKAMVQATIPHSKPNTAYFERENGIYTLTMSAPSKIGLPYGTKPRLLLLWLTTQAVKTKKRTLVLGDSLSEFMNKLGLAPTGGRCGSITHLKEQMKRLFACSITCTRDDGSGWAVNNIQIASEANFWWNPQEPDQAGVWDSTITLNEDFFESLISEAVPIDMRLVGLIQGSPMAIDVYVWLTYRLAHLKKTTFIPWPLLHAQFGSQIVRRDNFQRNFREALHRACVLYPEAKVEPTKAGLTLRPSRRHIAC